MFGPARRAALAGTLIAALAAAQPAVAPAAKLETLLASRATGTTGVLGNGASGSADISADGRWVVFQSYATNLSPDDTDPTNDVYARDTASSQTVLVSRATGAAGAKGNGASFSPRISPDGRYVVFTSSATNLDPNDTDTASGVFVRDLVANTTTLVSHPPGGGQADDESSTGDISSNGRFVVFSTAAENLSTQDSADVRDIFVRDMTSGALDLVSRGQGLAGPAADNNSWDARITPDGRYVAFSTFADNLIPGDNGTDLDVYVRDRTGGTTTLVSRATGVTGGKGNKSSEFPTISADGRLVAFESRSSNLDPADPDEANDVFVRDLVADTTSLASRTAGPGGAKGNNVSERAEISDDGRFVAFQSLAANLHPVAATFDRGVFVRSLDASAAVDFVTRQTGELPARAGGELPAISADGRFVSFSSAWSYLSRDDPRDDMWDVFTRDRFAPALAIEGVQPPFSPQTVGTTSPPRVLTVRNAGPVPAKLGRVLSGGGDFVVSADGCSGQALPAGGTCTFALTFAPARTGTRGASVAVEDIADYVIEPDVTSRVEAPVSGTARHRNMRLRCTPLRRRGRVTALRCVITPASTGVVAKLKRGSQIYASGRTSGRSPVRVMRLYMRKRIKPGTYVLTATAPNTKTFRTRSRIR